MSGTPDLQKQVDDFLQVSIDLKEKVESLKKLEDGLELNLQVAKVNKDLAFALCCAYLSLNKIKEERPDTDMLKIIKLLQEKDKRIEEIERKVLAGNETIKEQNLRKRSNY